MNHFLQKLNKEKIYIFIVYIIISNLSLMAQEPSIILGRPTDTTITASILFTQNTEYYLQYGTVSGVYTVTTTTFTSIANTPDEIDLFPLLADTKYYYKMYYRTVGVGSYIATPEYSFHTQRAIGSTYTFTIEADEHLYDKKGVKNMYKITLDNEAKDNPDFMLSLGDIFGDDHNPFTITSGALDSLHRDYRPFLGAICHSIPFYICLGNHEGENDYYYSFTPPNNLCVWGTQWRKFYYPNPFPNSFYSGNTDNEPYGIGNPENYYAWTWGDALFVVLDVYRDECDTSAKPGAWSWTLGLPQYTWLKNTLESSTAKYKFVFAHHIRGQGRGGITNAKLFEWGGYDQNGTSFTFPTKRSGWAKPIHQLFIDNGVNVFFQGHDHVFAHEVLDGITYQAVPMAADSTYEIGKLANADAYVSDTLDGTGHIRVTVSPSCVQVDYIKAYLPADTLSGIHHNREVGFSYTIGNCSTSGLNETKQEEEIKIFPNPVNDFITIQNTNQQVQSTIRLQNTYGQTVLQTTASNIDVHQLASGMYYLIVETINSRIVKKIVVNH
ncbi:MAG: T9SS type A sorting domain-containing protein [Bacteroidota bacterium]